jgi:hypothetical protein
MRLHYNPMIILSVFLSFEVLTFRKMLNILKKAQTIGEALYSTHSVTVKV